MVYKLRPDKCAQAATRRVLLSQQRSQMCRFMSLKHTSDPRLTHSGWSGFSLPSYFNKQSTCSLTESRYACLLALVYIGARVLRAFLHTHFQ